MSDEDIGVREGAYISASVTSKKVPTAGPSSGVEKYRERHPDLFLFSQRRMIKQVENQTKYRKALRGMIDAEIEVRKSREQFEHLDQILDTVGMRIHDEHAEALATIEENNYRRSTRIMDAEIKNIEMKKELEKAKAKEATPGDEKTAEYWDREAQKIEEEERGRGEIERVKRKLKRERIRVLTREMNDEIDEYVKDEKKRFGVDIDLKDEASWSEDVRDVINHIRYEYEQMIADCQQ